MLKSMILKTPILGQYVYSFVQSVFWYVHDFPCTEVYFMFFILTSYLMLCGED